MKKIIIAILLIVSAISQVYCQELIEVESGIKISNSISAMPAAGMIRWNGSDFQGYDGSQWQSLTSSNNSNILSYFVSLPNGIQTLLNAGETIVKILAAGADPADFLGLKYLGGIIFKLEADGTGLMASESDFQTRLTWGCYGQLVNGADGTAVGTGAQNTIDIVNDCGQSPVTAAYLCYAIDLHDFDDWFLPSRAEFELMYSVLGGVNNIGGFDFGTYWTSTEYSTTHAWAASGDNGEIETIAKNIQRTVRPIRAF